MLWRFNEASLRLWQVSSFREGLDEILRTAIDFLSADKANLQLLDRSRAILTLEAQSGFEQSFLDFFAEVSAGQATACGQALRSGKRVVVEDIGAWESSGPSSEIVRAAGYRAVQSTPIIGNDGAVLGVLSTHFREKHRPAGHELQLLDLYVRHVASFIERHRKGEALRESEERYKGIFQNAQIGISIADLNGQFRSCNPAYSEMHGYTAEELRGLSYDDVVHPEDRARHSAAIARLQRQETASLEISNKCLAKGGKVLWVHKRVSLLRDELGRPTHIIGLVSDVTAQRRAEETLRESERRLQFVAERAAVGYWYRDIKADTIEWTALCKKLFGIPDEAPMSYGRFLEALHPEDRERAQQAIKAHFDGGEEYDVEYRALWPNGTIRWIQVKGSATFRNGEPLHMAGIALDITERKRHEEQIRLLMQEVNHRSKNMLTIVQAIARQTAATGQGDFLPRFNDRICALALSQDLLVQTEWKGVDLFTLIRSQLAYFKHIIGDRILLKGPALLVSASAAQTLGMILHELATNAGKYGALSNEDGRILIGWDVSADEKGAECFIVSWREAGGPAIGAPSGSGFGTVVIRTMAEDSLHAKVEIAYPATGLTWRLQCPAEEVIERK
jgi:PAS domain S-box-containing protein